jgi:hypothetical protein
MSITSMCAEVIMPRSPTQAMATMPRRSLSLANGAAAVAGSAVLPSKTSTAIGPPSALQIGPKTICGSSRAAALDGYGAQARRGERGKEVG